MFFLSISTQKKKKKKAVKIPRWERLLHLPQKETNARIFGLMEDLLAVKPFLYQLFSDAGGISYPRLCNFDSI